MKPLVIDLETSVDNDQIGKFKASPFYKDNKIVAVGVKHSNDPVVTLYKSSTSYPIAVDSYKDTLLVGHNIKFDLLYLMRDYRFRDWLVEGRIWDTMLAEYVITGQEHQYASLNDLALKYGGTQKNDKIKEYWDNGIRTEDIPPAELVMYLEDDVKNTYTVLLGQIAEVKRRNLFDLLAVEFDALLATTEMEWNGLYTDQPKLEELREQSEIELDTTERILTGYLYQRTGADLNPGSNHHISAFLFGGVFKQKEKHYQTSKGEWVTNIPEDAVVYKGGARAGQPKTKLIEVEHRIEGIGLVPEKEWETKHKGVYQVGDDILRKLMAKYPDHKTTLDLILVYRERSKDYNTYYLGYGKLVWPHDSCIHGTINHVGTNTGRLSSSNPNLQNLSNGGD